MNDQDIIEGHAIAIPARIENAMVHEGVPRPLAMLDANTPEEYMDRISRVCKILVDVVEKQKLAKKLGRGDKKHVELEAWQFLGSMPWVRCAATIEWTKEFGGEGSGLGWEARSLVYRDGNMVGSGEGMCLRSEANWKAPKDYFALRSMAQSRAMSRALQGPLRFIFVLAGYAGAGQEEMPADAVGETPAPKAPPTPRATDTPADRERGRIAVVALASKHGVSDAARHLIAEVLFGEPSTKKLATPQLRALYAEIFAFIAAKVADDPIEIEGWLVYRQTERELAEGGR